ncbi:MAG TPA: menaquinone biosynthesis protein [Humidesulfovibrio sp.]|uniref:menaquinone biosynthetic enzyme MqnA/MqnD family protein n=1 Tax=Humidesulfovibrio sp. TaxID=2910988 RepID=UPI002B951075|nr:menaquinone biosynthesis protein [Humidesulfovibrio sp.]HWR03649.1 menaquinone biosynthesis protein [Humidesulfovibrio sp.]
MNASCTHVRPIKLGRIGYLNVLPLHYPLEQGILTPEWAGGFELIAGPPAELNVLMDHGRLDLSGCSCIEYARHPEKYFIVPDLAIGSRGPVQSVLLLCRTRPEDLDGTTILASAQSHTSAALVDLLLRQHIGVTPRYETGDATALLKSGQRPEAILCIGDEALNLRRHPDYPYRMDLGEAWREWTGLPFIFGLWIASREAVRTRAAEVAAGARLLIEAKKWGQAHLDRISAVAAPSSILTEAEMRSYFDGLVYDLGEEELSGLRLFYERLAGAGVIPAVPELCFLPLD